ncbi:MAG: Cation efflux system protein CusB [Steroidobacteraceae bacterium]|nr:Cation efflux system protein CusB [Steroidobacteraceae bacterium]
MSAIVAGTLALLALGVAVGVRWERAREAAATAAAPHATTPHGTTPDAGTTRGPKEPRVLYWYDPMVPDQHFDKPGKSPFMDMELVPKYAEEGAEENGIRVTAAQQQSLGVRTTQVKRGRLEARLEVAGTIGWDLRKEHVIDARVPVIVERLHVKTPFAPVRAGQPLARLIAPEWSAALAEVHALDAARDPDLFAAAQARLAALGLPPGARAARDGRIEITAPVTGTVSEIGVREGASVAAGTRLFRVNGLDTVWCEAALPEAQAQGVDAGATVTVYAHGDATPITGRIDALLPEIDGATRTRRARIVLDNRAQRLTPGAYVRVALDATDAVERPLVPTDAVIGSGEAAHVIVQAGDGSFRPVHVRTGRSARGETQIMAGLEGGERVVVAAQFLIDSEASLTGALERLGGPEPAP